MIKPIIIRQDGHPTLTKVPDLSAYTAEEIEAHKVPEGNPYIDKLGKDSLFDIRHKAWLESSLATLLNKASAKDVCWHWSHAADSVIKEVFKKHCDPNNIAVFALGKLGAQELNLSSDIDLLFVCLDATPEATKQVRQFQAEISTTNSLGFLFRCDLELRPGGRSSPLVPTVDQVIDYYGNYGETWERIAYVRCRYVTGALEIKNQIEPFLKRFIYRKHLDFALFDDLKGLREKIQKAVKTENNQIHLKLVPGGIRDIELFTNSLQVIHGGKNSSLQVTNTSQAFNLIKSEKILPESEITFFENLYWRLRTLENYVQALHDDQTHSIKKNMTHPPHIMDLLDNLETDLNKSSQIVSELLGGVTNVPTEEIDQDLRQILEIPLLSRNKERDQKTREVFIHRFSDSLGKSSGNRAMAISFLKEFVNSVRAKSGLFTLLAREQNLADDLAWLFGHSPYLSNILCQRPELLDSFVYRTQELNKEEIDLFLEQLLEKRLLGEIIQGTDFLKTRNIENLLNNLSQIADEVVLDLIDVFKCQDLKVLALGKWGGRELGFRSDLDFIFVVDDEPNEIHFKMARRIISRLTETHKGGSLYAIDMRLKPSGKAGPIIVKESELIHYLSYVSEPWERQAYLKARGLNWSSRGIKESCYNNKITEENLAQLEDIRVKLIRISPLDLKYSEGGLLDLELFAQTYLLINDIPAKGSSTYDFLSVIPHSEILQRNYRELRLTEQLLHLISYEGESDLEKKADYIHTLAALFKKSQNELKDRLKHLLAENRELLIELDPRRRSS